MCNNVLSTEPTKSLPQSPTPSDTSFFEPPLPSLRYSVVLFNLAILFELFFVVSPFPSTQGDRSTVACHLFHILFFQGNFKVTEAAGGFGSSYLTLNRDPPSPFFSDAGGKLHLSIENNILIISARGLVCYGRVRYKGVMIRCYPSTGPCCMLPFPSTFDQLNRVLAVI